MTLADQQVDVSASEGAADAAPELRIIQSVDESGIADNKVIDRYTTSIGVVFKLKKVPNLLIAEASRRIKMPQPPVVFIEDKGREEENPNDPTFVAALREAQLQQGMMGVNVYITFGTELESVPDDVADWRSEEWSDDITEITGVPIPIKGKARYCAWIKYVALSDEDLTNLNMAIARLSGNIPEADVQEAEEAFRDNEERPVSTRDNTTEEV